MNSLFKLPRAMVIGVFALIMFTSACSSPAAAPTNTAAAPTAAPASDAVIQLSDLSEEFKADPKGAEAKYKGKALVIEGTVKDTKPQFSTPTVFLRESEDLPGIRCFFDDASTATKDLKEGQKIKVKATIANGDNVTITGQACSLAA
jgi:hypothetical protein